jgi:hypothetical protein
MFKEYINSDIDYTSDEEIDKLYDSEEEALYALYEQLFDSLNNVCKETILNSMKYLIYQKQMRDQMEEMTHMREEDVCVIHHRERDKSNEETTKEIKHKLYEFLEEII